EEKTFKKYKKIKNGTSTMLDPAYTVAMFNRWVNQTKDFEGADVVYLLTRDPIYDFMGAYKLEMKAASYHSGPCIDRRGALSNDDGRTFSGVYAMVQQIANMFAINWDDSRSPTSKCRVDEGYIMTRNGEATTSANFSSCSYRAWETYYFWGNRGKNCFNRTPCAMSSENDLLPADYYNGSDYCEILFGIHEEAQTRTENSQSSKPPLNTVPANYTCKLSCCVNETVHTVNSPDGTPCGSDE
ncbi:unnamed protein product, partial [Ixodes hexagonus]